MPNAETLSAHGMPTRERERIVTDVEMTLTKTMADQWKAFKEERDAWEAKKQIQERMDKEVEAKAEKEKYDALLELSLQEAQERVKQAKLRNKILGFIAAAITGGGGYLVFVKKEPAPAVQPEDVKEVVEKKAADEARRLDEFETRQQRLGLQAVESHIQQVEATDYIVEKIDAAHPKSADKVEEPETISESRDQAKSIVTKKKLAKLRGQDYDPFEDLPRP